MQRLPVLLMLALAAGVSARAPQNPPCSHDRDCVKWHTHDRRSSCNLRTRECEDDAAFPAARLGAEASSCPPVELQPNFNVTEFVRASWFVQRQQVNGYQSLDDLYCVSATYDLEGKKVPFFSGTVVTVFDTHSMKIISHTLKL